MLHVKLPYLIVPVQDSIMEQVVRLSDLGSCCQEHLNQSHILVPHSLTEGSIAWM